ncbi:MAG: sigma-70 family RNA polymerase sigma factor [Planctomycetota bacterium]
MQDSDLISRYRAGDGEAFAQLYHRYKGMIAGCAFAITGSREDADNIVQEVFLAAIRRADSLRPEGNFRAYLLIRARGLALNLRRVRAPVPGDCSGAVSTAPGPDEIVANSEQSERVTRALAELPPEQSEVIALRAHSGMTVKEIAEMLDEPLGTIKSRYRYALEKLRASLSEEEQ